MGSNDVEIRRNGDPVVSDPVVNREDERERLLENILLERIEKAERLLNERRGD